MLPRPARVRTRVEFAAVTRTGRRCGTGTLVASVMVSPDGPGGARAGFVVGKSVGNAVVRNRVRRRLRHLVAARLAALRPGTTLVVRALPRAATAPTAALARDLDTALRRCTGSPV